MDFHRKLLGSQNLEQSEPRLLICTHCNTFLSDNNTTEERLDSHNVPKTYDRPVSPQDQQHGGIEWRDNRLTNICIIRQLLLITNPYNVTEDSGISTCFWRIVIPILVPTSYTYGGACPSTKSSAASVLTQLMVLFLFRNSTP